MFVSQIAFAQSDCSCEKELDFVMGYYERNLASFSDNVNAENKAEYETFKQQLREETKTVKHTADCFRVFNLLRGVF